MKLTKYFMPLAAVALLASCSNDKLDGPSQDPETSSTGDFHMTLNITPVGNNGTRTATDNQGSEVGQDYENAIKSAILLLTNEQNVVIAKVDITAADIVGVNPNYAASFTMARETLYNSYTDTEKTSGKNFRLYVIANPKDMDTKTGATAWVGATIQDVVSSTTPATYWSSSDGFLMTNYDYSQINIPQSEFEKGKHATKATALNLGVVKIQRAVSRFDLAIPVEAQAAKAWEYTIESNGEQANATAKQTYTVKIDRAALVNMSNTFNLFKEVGSQHNGDSGNDEYKEATNGMNSGTYDPNTYCYFRTETPNGDFKTGAVTDGNYVFSPAQTAFNYPLYGEDEGTASDGVLTGVRKDLASLAWIDINIINKPDADNYVKPGDANTTQPDYFIWTYALENTNYDFTQQFNGNSTGIVFRAEITGSYTTYDEGNKVTTAKGLGDTNEPIYAYNNTIFGTWNELQAYIANEVSGDKNWPIVRDIVNGSVKEAKDAKDSGVPTQLEIDKVLASHGMTIYRPDSDGKFFCYYIYFNRHNDNGDNAQMGPMEFATVRNNIYKINVKSIVNLGHPGKPDDDPDPGKPEDEVEKTEFWGVVECQVVDWEVRINEVNF